MPDRVVMPWDMPAARQPDENEDDLEPEPDHPEDKRADQQSQSQRLPPECHFG